MGEYLMLVNHRRSEYVAMKHCRLANKSWAHLRHGLFVTWIMEYSAWKFEPAVLVADERQAALWNAIENRYKDVEVEMIKGFNEFIKDTHPEHVIEIEEAGA